MTSEKPDDDMSALAKGGRQNFFGFILRLVARLPFLFIAGRLYGPDALGRFASALVVVELVALVCAMGEKRGLAQRPADGEDSPPSNLVHDGNGKAIDFQRAHTNGIDIDASAVQKL